MKLEVSPAYTAAHAAAAYCELSAGSSDGLGGHGWLRLTGRDRLDLLHRLSTNDLRKLSPGDGRPTVLSSPTGRVMALLIVYADSEAIFVRTQPGQAAGITRYLNSMIFWQDQVEVADLSAEAAQFGLYGPTSTALLSQLSGLDLTDVPAYSWRAAHIAGASVSFHRGGPLEAPAWTIVAPTENSEAVRSTLAEALPMFDLDAVDLLRIEAGIPAWGRELSDQVTPLESGLLSAISFTKGCYTGQEVIARQVNYDKITRNLVGLLLLGDAPGADLAGATVRGPGRGGFVGSAAFSPALGRTIALAVVPRELAQPGTEVSLVHEEHEYRATVDKLPFG